MHSASQPSRINYEFYIWWNKDDIISQQLQAGMRHAGCGYVMVDISFISSSNHYFIIIICSCYNVGKKVSRIASDVCNTLK